MRVLLIGPTKPQLCGVSHHVHWVAAGLVARGHEVEVVTYRELGLEDAPYRIHRLRTIGLPDQRFNLRGLSFLLAGCLRRGGLKPDLIHAHTSVPAGLLGLALARRWRRPLVYTMHNDLAGRGAESWRGRALQIVRSGADASTSVVPAPGFEWIPNAIDGLHPSVGRAPDAAGPVRVLFVGHLNETKGVSDLVVALRGLDHLDMAADILGGGAAGAEDHYRDMVAAAGLAEVVQIRGIRPSEPYFEQSDLFVLPSRSEGLPTVLLEAIAFGLPVVATRVGAVEEVVGPGHAGLVEPGDSDELRGVLERAIADAMFRQSLVVPPAHLERFTWPVVLRQYEAVYESVVRA